MAEDSVDPVVRDVTARYPVIDPEVEGVVDRVAAINKHLARALETTLTRQALNHGEYKLLVRIATRADGRPLSAGQLSRGLMLSSGAMTNRLDRLEVGGLIRRIRDDRDRRGVLVELTAAGRRTIDRAVEEQAGREAEALGALSQADLASLNRLLRKALIALEADGGATGHDAA
jgi:DNA-binding MarR family transcriptional regulator